MKTRPIGYEPRLVSGDASSATSSSDFIALDPMSAAARAAREVRR
jgi:hypothetical protein